MEIQRTTLFTGYSLSPRTFQKKQHKYNGNGVSKPQPGMNSHRAWAHRGQKPQDTDSPISSFLNKEEVAVT